MANIVYMHPSLCTIYFLTFCMAAMHNDAPVQITVGSDSLTEELEVVNGTSAETPLKFTSALHTYFRISDISQAHVEGLSGLKYLDNMQNRQEGTDESQVIYVNGEIDRIYVKAPDHLKVTRAVPHPMHNFFSVVMHCVALPHALSLSTDG